jgi:hypothetical protein
MRRILIPFLLLLIVSRWVMASPTVVINEIMYNPPTSMGPDYDYEWIELYNPTDADVAIGGWSVEDASGGGYTLPDNAIIPAKSYLVIARNAVKVKSYYSTDRNFDATAVHGDATFSLNNDGDTIILKDNKGSIIDQVQYSPSWGADGNGKTLERKNPYKPSNDPLNWAESGKDGGTPTYQNTIQVPFFGSLISVTLVVLGFLLKRK